MWRTYLNDVYCMLPICSSNCGCCRLFLVTLQGGLSAAGMADLGGELLVVSRAGGSDRCVVALASSGLLEALVAAAKRHGASDEQDTNAKVGVSLQACSQHDVMQLGSLHVLRTGCTMSPPTISLEQAARPARCSWLSLTVDGSVHAAPFAGQQGAGWSGRRPAGASRCS